MYLKTMGNKIRTKVIFLFISILFCDFQVEGQNTIEIQPCSTKGKQDFNKFAQVSLIWNADTLIIPKIAKNKYLQPYKFYSLNLKEDENDTCSVQLFIDGPNFTFICKVARQLFFCSRIQLCVDPKMDKYGGIWFGYLNCSSIWIETYLKPLNWKGHISK